MPYRILVQGRKDLLRQSGDRAQSDWGIDTWRYKARTYLKLVHYLVMAESLEPTVTMRPLLLEDWTSIHEWSQLEDVYRFQVWGPNSLDETLHFVEVALTEAALKPRTRFVWAAEDSDHRVIGIAELRTRDAHSGRGEVSYIVHPDRWRNGYATRMASWVIAFAFAELEMHRVEATCDPRNAASAAVLRKVGMTYEGRSREVLKIRDGWRDSEIFSILKAEWTQ